MHIPDKKLRKFQELYENRFGIKISEDDARIIGNDLIAFLQSVYSPMNKREFNAIKKTLAE